MYFKQSPPQARERISRFDASLSDLQQLLLGEIALSIILLCVCACLLAAAREFQSAKAEKDESCSRCSVSILTSRCPERRGCVEAPSALGREGGDDISPAG